jgi:ElaB/YqjD/DUF883 family membrane-anchored ribosome-binding protein
MSSEKKVVADVNEDRIGRKTGEAVGRELKPQLRELNNRISEVRDAVQELERNVEGLKYRIEEIEATKANAQRKAREGLKDDLKERLDEARAEYNRRVAEVLDDYRNSIERLKDRFLGSISGREEQFDQVESEFADVVDSREKCIDSIVEVGQPATTNYRRRLDAVNESRNAFLSAIDDFLSDREETAATIDSLQTSIPDIDGATTVTVPFWVVGIRKDGQEEIRVLPMLQRDQPDASPDRANTYVEYLREHPTHSYGDMRSAVHSYVTRDRVRNTLASREGEFVDPSFLRRNDIAAQRFVDALEEFELADRTDDDRDTTDRDRESGKGQTEVPADD